MNGAKAPMRPTLPANISLILISLALLLIWVCISGAAGEESGHQ